MRGAGRISGARGRTCRQEVPRLHCPGDASHSGATARVGAGALALRPSSARALGPPLSAPSSGARGPSRAASSPDRAAPVPAPQEEQRAPGAPG